ncbi:uncharacterized protein LOC125520102 [Triticum urartu]|uniref:WRKY19-like zinc finger domain-containing protein n=1 Tax=Triticum urartu TaxID=4572 RepID=A0A8R7R3X2_TRIUA|nr:uncharacterized protein LOC125520102 [Triticum urartu]
MSGPPVFSVLQGSNTTHSIKGQQISMIGNGHSFQQGVYVMDPSSFNQGIYAEKQSSFAERANMMQLNNFMADNSSPAGNRCQRLGCNEVVEGQTAFCKSHRLGQQCQMIGCPQIPPNGVALCMTHGGGHPGSSAIPLAESEGSMKYEGDGQFRVMENAMGSTVIPNPDGEVVMCKYEGCSKRSQGNTVYCKVHSGGSKACMVKGCTKGAHGGTPMCIAHGGGKRCSVAGCRNAACGSSQGRTDCCVRHGGGKRCKHDGCGKGAQGNTDFCIGHGGGRRCKFEGCGKSAQGRSDNCIKHGGGRRCKFEGCSASAKWGVDFCSAHRKSMLGEGDTADGAPKPKRRAKKSGTKKAERAKRAKKTADPAGPSSEDVTMPAVISADMPEMGAIHVAAPVPDRPKSPETAIALEQPPLQLQQPPPLQSPAPSGLAASAEEGLPATGSVFFGL